MKKLTIAIFLACTMSISVYGQNGLSFNQVITDVQQLTVSGGGVANTTLLTVPQGKVWKIESVAQPATSGASLRMILNGVACANEGQSPASISGNTSNLVLPIWLKEGDNVQFQYRYQNTNTAYTYNVGFFISILEFNVN